VKTLPLVLIVYFLCSCQKDGQPDIRSCISNSSEIETNKASTPTNYTNSDRVSLRVQIFQGIKVQRILLKASNISNLLLDVEFYRGSNTLDPDKGQLVGSAMGTAKASSSILTETWFELDHGIDLAPTSDPINDGYSVVIRFAGGITLDYGSSYGSILRSQFRTSATPSSWSSPDPANTISFGLGGEIGCD
jgi:hypothetical protein